MKMEELMEKQLKRYEVKTLNTIRDMLFQMNELYSEKTAFLVKSTRGDEYTEISFFQFKKDVESLSTKLLNMGFKGSNIAIMGGNSYQWLVAYFAIVSGVGTAVPLDKELNESEVQNLIERANCKACFCSANYKGYLENSKVNNIFQIDIYQKQDSAERENHILNLIQEGETLVKEGCRDFDTLSVEEDDVAEILYTSGTTGTPKGVMLTHKNITHVIRATSMIVNLKKDDRTLSFLPIHHSFELTLGIMVPLFQGCSIAFCEGLKYILKNLKESKASIMVVVPLIVETIYKKLLNEVKNQGKEKKFNSAVKWNRRINAIGINASKKIFKQIYESLGGNLRMFICGAAPLNPAVLKGLTGMGFVFLQGYGLTETAPLVTGVPDFTDYAKKPASCGPVIPGVNIKIVEPDADGIGEIYISGPNVMKGYKDMPEETAEVMDGEWFKSGDLGFVDSSGWLYLTGRSKNVIVTNTGKNIYPEEIEPLINDIDYVTDCMIYGLKQEGGSDHSVAVQIYPNYDSIAEEMGQLSDEEIYELLKDKIYEINKQLPSYKRVKKIKVRKEDFIRTNTKKIKRNLNV